MKALYPPFGDPNELPRRILVVAPHPDDEIIGVGGMLAFHAQRGDTVRIVVASDGAGGDPDALAQDLAKTRITESENAAKALGLDDPDFRFLGLPDGALGSTTEYATRLREEFDAFDPGVIYAPSPQELHPDHRATARAVCEALSHGPERRVLFYGINSQVTANVLYDTTPFVERKKAALECFVSQMAYHDMPKKSQSFDRSRTMNIEDPNVDQVEGFCSLTTSELGRYERSLGDFLAFAQGAETSIAQSRGLPETTAVISTWNKKGVVQENLDSLHAQTLPFASIVVVDNASSDGTAEMIARDYPEVRLVVMPHSQYGACETFNIGFASATTPLVAILDDDITLPPTWLEHATARLMEEPETTAVVSTEIIEPGMPAEYIASSKAMGRRYMSTFRGCGSLARREVLAQAGYYDERLFIYGNERDLTCRLLNAGYRVLQDPDIETYHKTPFGIQMGKRSLFYHARNAWLTMIKYAPLSDLVRLPFLVVKKVLLRSEKAEASGEVTDATGTIGIGKAIRETPGAFWVLCKAGASVLYNVPYCLRNRKVVRADDFELPLG